MVDNQIISSTTKTGPLTTKYRKNSNIPSYQTIRHDPVRVSDVDCTVNIAETRNSYSRNGNDTS